MKNKILTIFLLSLSLLAYSQKDTDAILIGNMTKTETGLAMSYIFMTGVFMVITLIHLSLFSVYKKQKANLYFFIAAFSAVLSFILYILSIYKSDFFINIKYQNILSGLFSIISSIFLFIAIFTLIKEPKGKLFWVLIGTAPIVIFYQLFFYDIGGIIGFLHFIITRGLILILTIKSYRQGNKEFGMVVLGLILFWILFFIVYFMNTNILSNPKINDHFKLVDIIGLLSTLTIPLCISIFLSREFGRTRIDLEKQLLQVQQLSQEKQETLEKQNTELQAALLKGQTTERQRVALDLHDNLGSTISSIKYSLEAIDRSKMNADELAVQENLYSLLDKAYNDVRLLSHNLLPEEFEKLGLTETLKSFLRKMNKNSNIKFELVVDENFGRVDKKVEFELYSICLELVNNIIKHSKATDAEISLSRTDNQLLLLVSDNGIGTFNNESDGRGMKNVQARVDSINGTWTVKAAEGEGVVNEIVV